MLIIADSPRKNFLGLCPNFVGPVHDRNTCITAIVSKFLTRYGFPGVHSDIRHSRLQHAPSPDPRFGFYVLGKPLSVICHGAALGAVTLGALKTWRTQNAIVRGKALAGGFELVLVGVGVLVVSPGDPRLS